MRICVIFNPVARGDKARRFRRQLEQFGGGCALKPTPGAGAGRALAAEAVAEGFDTIVAAGGDGTLNEVINGIADAPDGLARARLGLIPLGTANVFAKELGLPIRLEPAWEVVRRGRELVVDLPWVEFQHQGRTQRRCFAQLAGAGLDSRAIELVDWQTKKSVAQVAYILAGFKALCAPQPRVTVELPDRNVAGELVLIGNGRFYGGRLPVFPNAHLQDGLLDFCVFPRVTWLTAVRYGLGFVTGRVRPPAGVHCLQAPGFVLRSEPRIWFELDGENAGHLPARFSMQPRALRVLVPLA